MAKKSIKIKIKKPVKQSPAVVPDAKAKVKKKQKAPKPAVVAEVAKAVKSKGKPKTTPTNKQAVVKASPKQGAKIDWSIIKTKYITDPKATHRSLEAEFKVSRSAIAARAKKEDWSGQRQEWIKKHDSNVLEAAGEDREEMVKQVTDSHKTLLGKLSERLSGAVDRLSKDEWEAKNIEALAKAAKLVIEGERLTVGLPSDVKGLSDPRGDKLNVTIESLHEKAKAVVNGNSKS